MLTRLKNSATILAAVILFVLGFLAYGIPPPRLVEPPAPPPAARAAAEPSRIGNRMVITSNNGAAEDDKERREEERLQRELFEKKFPDATLRPSTWQFSPDSFFAKAIGETLPDIIGMFLTEATLVVDKRLAADITEQVKSWHLYPYLERKMVEPLSREGRIFGIPNGGANGGMYVMTLFYNNELFRRAGIVDETGKPKPPQTWDQFVETAKRLTDRSRGISGFGILGENGGNAWHFLNWVWQAGGDFERQMPDGTWKAVFDEPQAVHALQFIKDLRWKHNVLQRNVIANNDDLFQMFASNRIGMAIFTPEYLLQLVDKYSMDVNRIGIALLPAGPAGRANQMGGAFTLISPRTTGLRKQRAFDAMVINYDLEMTELNLKLSHEQGRPIGIPGIPIFAPEYQDKLDAIVNKYRNLPDLSDLMKQATDAVRLEPPYRCQALYSQYLGPAVQEVLVDRNADPERLLRTAAYKFQVRELDPINKTLVKLHPAKQLGN